MKKGSIRITEGQLKDAAIDSLKQHRSLKKLHEFVKAARGAGMLDWDDAKLERFLDENRRMFEIVADRQISDDKKRHTRNKFARFGE